MIFLDRGITMSIINTGSVVSGAAGTYDNVASSKESGTSIGTLNSVAQILAGTMSVSPPGAFPFLQWRQLLQRQRLMMTLKMANL